jgi:hypothetical protein
MAEEECKRAEQVLEDNKDAGTPDALRSAYETLQSVAHKLAESLYKTAAPEDAGGGGGPGPSDDQGAPGGPGDVIDAEFEDKN